MTVPRYLSGDAAGIREFLDKFDVRLLVLIFHGNIYLRLTFLEQVFLFDCDGSLSSFIIFPQSFVADYTTLKNDADMGG